MGNIPVQLFIELPRNEYFLYKLLLFKTTIPSLKRARMLGKRQFIRGQVC